jgi:YVTN family beta-propeller protein
MRMISDRNKRPMLLMGIICFALLLGSAEDSLSTQVKMSPSIPAVAGSRVAGVPPVVHSAVGDSSAGWHGKLRLVNIGKRQQHNFADRQTLDVDILSPKSINFHPNGKRCYVNSLEGCKTVVYSVPDLNKIDVIEHRFVSSNGAKWANPSGYYKFEHYADGMSRQFQGKPVEATFSHDGRYLWVPYYRRTFDINAQDPSAIAVIDTATDSIIRMFETGPLPKMVAYCKSKNLIAITHWGDNTVGLIDISSKSIQQWHHLPPMVAGNKLQLNFPLNQSIDRDANSGYKLRGTVFTPDGNYLLVSSMGGPMHAFDMTKRQYVGAVQSAYGVRHLVIKDGMLYASQNVAATVMSIPLDSVISAVKSAEAKASKNIIVKGWRTCKVGGGARTLDVSPDGKLLFVACNSASEVCVIEAATMTVVDRIRVDSYPVGLDVSADGTLLAVTSQGRKGYGGNALNLFRIIRPGVEPFVEEVAKDSVQVMPNNQSNSVDCPKILNPQVSTTLLKVLALLCGVGLCIVLVNLVRRNKNCKKKEADSEYKE